MNIIKFLLILGGLFIFIISCGQDSQLSKNKKSKGTLIEFNKCIENNKNQGLNDNVLQKLCLRNYQQDITDEIDLGGRAAYEYDFFSKKNAFAGYFENKSYDYVVTYAQIFVNHKENPDIEILELEWLFIQPGEKNVFSFSELKFSPNTNSDTNKFSWSIAKVKGLKIKLK